MICKEIIHHFIFKKQKKAHPVTCDMQLQSKEMIHQLIQTHYCCKEVEQNCSKRT